MGDELGSLNNSVDELRVAVARAMEVEAQMASVKLEIEHHVTHQQFQLNRTTVEEQLEEIKKLVDEVQRSATETEGQLMAETATLQTQVAEVEHRHGIMSAHTEELRDELQSLSLSCAPLDMVSSLQTDWTLLRDGLRQQVVGTDMENALIALELRMRGEIAAAHDAVTADLQKVVEEQESKHQSTLISALSVLENTEPQDCGSGSVASTEKYQDQLLKLRRFIEAVDSKHDAKHEQNQKAVAHAKKAVDDFDAKLRTRLADEGGERSASEGSQWFAEISDEVVRIVVATVSQVHGPFASEVAAEFKECQQTTESLVSNLRAELMAEVKRLENNF